ncbi:type VII secretion integral membrane protein EccD [Actinorhabdospora filicis]|uniref:Type VII secretion integral membrane protein EccD n=1 Tax=Actinorhabdospora filicis TaxID=1785913 RepID=A0A9W6WA26_9ACTN|nr:type VII secretion integral membrane protein EccD [Actinorhabdospora filicis]GLZ77210.1 type VII secretion integral membrane protein EccD [Actinorhabdospora filicis]
MTLASELCLVTIVAPHTRMDVALPGHVPLSDLLSDLLQHAADGPRGEDLVEDGAAQGGWVLSRLGKAPLDADLTPAQLGIVDGEELYFTPFVQAGPEAVFDDVIDAMATATNERVGRWRTETSKVFGTVFAAAALLAGAAALLFTGTSTALWSALGVGGLMLCAALILARALGNAASAAIVGLLSLPYGLIAGLLLLGDLPALTGISGPRVMAAGAVATVFAVLCGIVVIPYAPVFLCAAMCGAALTASGALSALLGANPAEAGAAVATIAVAFVPALPMLSFRISRLPMPTVPKSPQQLRQDGEKVDGEIALVRSERADQHLTGMLTAVAIVAAAAMLALALGNTLPATIMAGLLTALCLMRARVFLTIRQRLPFLLAGTAGLVSLGIEAWTGLGDNRMTGLLGGTLFLAVVALSYTLGVAGKRVSPIWGRIVDILELLLVVAVIPMAAWVWNLYWAIRTVNG